MKNGQFLTGRSNVWIVGVLICPPETVLSPILNSYLGRFWETGRCSGAGSGQEPSSEIASYEKMDELAMDLKAESLGDLSGLSPRISRPDRDFLKGTTIKWQYFEKYRISGRLKRGP